MWECFFRGALCGQHSALTLQPNIRDPQVMKRTEGRADPKAVTAIFEAALGPPSGA